MDLEEKVLIIGLPTFLGSTIVGQLLKTGQYKLRASVSAEDTEEKLAPIREAFGDDFEKIEIVEMDLSDRVSVEKAVKCMDYVIQTETSCCEEQSGG